MYLPPNGRSATPDIHTAHSNQRVRIHTVQKMLSTPMRRLPTTRLTVRSVTTSSHSKQQAAIRPQQAKPFNSIPGPKPLPLLGNFLDIVKVRKSGENLFEFYDKGFKKYGEIMKITIPG